MAKRRMRDNWVVSLIPPVAVAAFLVWLMRDVWRWF